MKEWIFTLFAVSIVGYVAKILLPNGKTKNYLVFILSIVSVCALIFPIGTFSNYDDYIFSFEEVNAEIIIDENYLKEYRQNYYFTIANSQLKKNGIEIKKIDFIFEDDKYENSLKKIKIFYGDIVMNENNQHINISSITKNLLSNLFNIDEGEIEIYG